MKRLLMNVVIVAGIIAGSYFLYNNQLEADDGDISTSTSTSTSIPSTSTPDIVAPVSETPLYEGPSITTTIDGEKTTLTPAAIHLSSVLKEMFAVRPDDDSDDSDDEAEDPPIEIKVSPAVFKNFGLTPMVVDMLNSIGELKQKNSQFSDAELVLKYLENAAQSSRPTINFMLNVKLLGKVVKFLRKHLTDADQSSRPTINFKEIVRVADMLNVKLLWDIVAAQYAHLLHDNKKTLNDLKNDAQFLAKSGWKFNKNSYSPFGAEVFRQYWLIFKEDKKNKDVLLKGFSSETINNLERISKGCFYKEDPNVCFEDKNILIPTFFTFGVSIQEMLDYGRKLHPNKLSSMHIGSLIGLEKIEGLGSLHRLWLNNNQIKSIPAKIEGLGSLQYLYLINNQITEFPAKIEGLGSLQGLWLKNNQIKSIPAKIEGLGSLRRLWLNNNQISSIPAEIKGLGSLWWLDLNNNQISSIPAKIEGLGSLRELRLNNNQISSIPENIKGLESLTVLDLGNNQITEFPKKIKGLGSLWWLDLTNNQISSIPAKIEGLGSLQ